MEVTTVEEENRAEAESRDTSEASTARLVLILFGLWVSIDLICALLL